MGFRSRICDCELKATQNLARCTDCGLEAASEYACPQAHYVCETCRTASAGERIERTCFYDLQGVLVVDLRARLGVRAQAAPVNDVLVEGRKVYGSTQIELGDGVAHSGTFLVHADLDAMAAALRPSRLKYAHQGSAGLRIPEAIDRLRQGVLPADVMDAPAHLLGQGARRPASAGREQP